MKVGVLFSGGKDSVYASFKCKEVVCLISVKSENPDSYMFHTPNIDLVKLQSEALGIPLVFGSTKGEKEEELEDLRKVIVEAKEKFGIESVGVGAIASEYQNSRVKRICDSLGLKVMAPLWGGDAEEYMKKLIEDGFEVIITAIAADGFSSKFLGRRIDYDCLKDLVELNKKYGISVCGEGGEFESLVLDCPLFNKKIKILDFEKVIENEFTGKLLIKKAELVEK